MRVGYQGEPGAYSEAATFQLLGRQDVTPVGLPSFEAVFQAVEAGDCDAAMIPIENVRALCMPNMLRSHSPQP